MLQAHATTDAMLSSNALLPKGLLSSTVLP
jgi:hypothetical protein